MELRVLEYYLMVVREENIPRAPNLLHITQPTLSWQLSQLEEELGVRLFKRGKHNITLTEEGLLLKRRAQEMVDLADKTRRELVQGQGELSGTISIGSGETKSIHLLAELMTEFRRLHPGVSYDIYSNTADHIKDRIEKGLTDIGLLTEPVEVGKYQFVRIPEKLKWGVLVRRDSPLAQKKEIRPEDLLGVPVLLAKRDSVRNELANWFGDCYERLDIASTFNLLYNASALVESMNGAALCMELDTRYQNLVFVPLEPRLTAGAVLVWKKNQFFTQTVEQFIKFIMNARERDNWAEGGERK